MTHKPSLTDREEEILLELAKGPDKNSVVARKLGIDRLTLKTHLASMRKKAGARNQVQLLRWAFREAIKIMWVDGAL